jgi:hypothetical protein
MPSAVQRSVSHYASHVPGDWFNEDRGYCAFVLLDQNLDGGDVVEFRIERVGGGRSGHSGTVGQAERGNARTGFAEKRISVAVITALKFYDFFSPGISARQAHRTHRGLCA